MENTSRSKNQLKVNVSDLKPGMFVCRLDRPWIETPFLMQGILIKSEREIEAISRHCYFVYIDIERSKAANYPHLTPDRPINSATGKPLERRQNKRTIYETSASLHSSCRFINCSN